MSSQTQTTEQTASPKVDCVNWVDLGYELHTPRQPAIDDTPTTVAGIAAANARRDKACVVG